jgi:ISXO2-like transposase domain
LADSGAYKDVTLWRGAGRGYIPDTKARTLQSNVRKNVQAGGTVYSDAFPSYFGLDDALYFSHQGIDHAERYVDGRVHTNGMENLDEKAFTYNQRALTDLGWFTAVLGAVADRRLTYTALTSHNATSD